MFFAAFVLCILRLHKLKTEGQTIYKNLTAKLQNSKENSRLSWVSLIVVNGGRLVLKSGGLQRTNYLFWFMACHVIAKMHRISRWRAASSFDSSLREFILFFTDDLEIIKLKYYVKRIHKWCQGLTAPSLAAARCRWSEGIACREKRGSSKMAQRPARRSNENTQKKKNRI